MTEKESFALEAAVFTILAPSIMGTTTYTFLVSSFSSGIARFFFFILAFILGCLNTIPNHHFLLYCAPETLIDEEQEANLTMCHNFNMCFDQEPLKTASQKFRICDVKVINAPFRAKNQNLGF